MFLFSKECFRPLDWIMVVLMCSYALILIIFIVVYVVKIRPQYQLGLVQNFQSPELTKF